MEGLGGVLALMLGVLLVGGGIALIVLQFRPLRWPGSPAAPDATPPAAPDAHLPAPPAPDSFASPPPAAWDAAPVAANLPPAAWEAAPAATNAPPVAWDRSPAPANAPPPMPWDEPLAEAPEEPAAWALSPPPAVPPPAPPLEPSPAPPRWSAPAAPPPGAAQTAPIPAMNVELVPEEERLPRSAAWRGARPWRRTDLWRAAVAQRTAVPSRAVLRTVLGVTVTVMLVGIIIGFLLNGSGSSAQARPGSATLVVADFGEGPAYTGTSLGHTTAQGIVLGMADALSAADKARMPVVGAGLVRNSAAAAQELGRQHAQALLWGTLPAGATGDISATLTWRLAPPSDPWIRYGPAGRLLVPPEVPLPNQPLIGTKALTPALLALQYYQAGDYDRARVQAESLPQDAPPATQNLAAFIRANALMATSRPADALPLYRTLVARGWTYAAVYNNWGVAATTQGDFATAQMELQQAIVVAAPGDKASLTRCYTNLGIAKVDAGDLAGAQAALDQALAQEANDPEANWQRSYLAYEAGDTTTATRYIRRAIAADSQNPAYPRQAGLIALMQRQPGEALGDFQQALAIYTAWDATLREQEGAAITRNDLPTATRVTAWLQDVNRERGTSSYYIGLAYADQALSKPPEGWFASAWRHLTGGQSEADQAIAAFQDAIRLDRDREDVRYQMGALYRYEGDRSQARDAFAQAKKLNPADPGPYEQLAQMDIEDKQPDQAAAEYQALIAANPGYMPAYIDLAQLDDQGGNHNGAQQVYARLVQVPAHTAREHYYRAQAFLALNRPGDAAVEARAAYTADPSIWEAHRLLGEIYAQAHQDTAALAEFQAVLALQPDNVEALYESGRIEAAQGQVDRAQQSWQRVATLQPDHAEVHFALGGLYMQKATLAQQAGKTGEANSWNDQAIREYSTAAAQKSHLADADYHLGQLYEQRSRWPDAEARYRESTQQNPDLVEAWQGLVRVLLKQPGRDADALQAAQDFQKHAPRDERSYLLLGQVFLYRLDANAARLQFDQALKLQPGDPQALIGEGQAYHLGSDDDHALQYYQAALQAQPNSAAALTGLGDLYYDQQHYGQAQDNYNRAQEADPNYEPAWTGLGRTLDRLQQVGEAVNKLKHAADLDPAAAEPHFYLGEVYSERQSWDLSIPEYQAATTRRPSWALPQYRLGQIYMTQQKLPEAVNAYQQATKLDPNMLEAWFGLGQAERDSGDRKDAIAAYQQALKLNNNYAAAWLYLGYTLEENGQRSDAITAFQNAVKSAADDATIRSAAEEALSRYQ